MSLSYTSVFVPSVVLATFVLILLRAIRNNSRHALPPGPSGLPLLGNALQMPTEHEWLQFSAWGKQYGDVMHLSIFGQPFIILNSARATTELLEKRSSLYADRPRLPMVGELVGYEDSIPLCVYGPRHREYRRLLFSGLAPRKAEEWHSVHEQKTREYLGMLLDRPEDFMAHIRRTVAAIVFQISHGYTVSGNDDPLVKLAERANEEFGLAAAPGAFLVDIFPILRHVPDWLPGTSFKQKAAKWRKTVEQLRDEPYETIKSQIAKGTALPSFTASLVEMNAQPSPEEENIYKWASTGFYAAGADTTVSAITSFFLAMALYPEVQKKAQAELDAVVGSTRLPTMADRARLPYIEGVIREVYRWNPVAPLAIPHRLVQDDVFDGYRIPAGSIVFANSWSILHDSAMYPTPMEFMPERYSATDDTPDLNPDPRAFAFGYGRRVCPGQALADASVFIAVAMTLASFNISKSVGADGQVIEPEVKYSSGTISQPRPFKCSITPRSNDAASLVRDSVTV